MQGGVSEVKIGIRVKVTQKETDPDVGDQVQIMVLWRFLEDDARDLGKSTHGPSTKKRARERSWTIKDGSLVTTASLPFCLRPRFAHCH